MDNSFQRIQELLRMRADYLARLRLLPYDGTPEVKMRGEGKYLYVRKRVAGKNTSTYVGPYSEELHQLLLRNARESRELRRSIRRTEAALADLGYAETELPPRILQNLEFARVNMKASIYDQAVLEGVATSFPQTEDILENGRISGVSAADVQKILNLKHAWEFIIDRDVIQSKTDYYVLCHIARLVNEGFFAEGGRLRGVPVSIGGTSYTPPLPFEPDVKDAISAIDGAEGEPIETAISLCLYCMKAQLFNDGNKRAAVLFANHFLIAHGGGVLVIPEAEVPQFKRLLIAYYEGRVDRELRDFLRERCWKRL